MTDEMAIRKWLVKNGYGKPVTAEELKAVRRCMLKQELGVPQTHADIDRELSLRRAHLERTKA